MRQPEIDHLLSNTDCLFVSVDYDDMTNLSSYVDEKYGEDRFKWWPSVCQHYEYDHTAALIAACDLTVTVCQSAAHLSAAMGRPTRVLTPKQCAWRYAPVSSSETWFWYPDPAIKLYRQDDPESWTGPLNRVIADIGGLR
jgi:ADP-heptose:LPS heptosyltransferase